MRSPRWEETLRAACPFVASREECGRGLACRCFVEAATSAGVKVGTRRLDLGKRTDLAMRRAYGGRMSPENKLEGVCAARRLPPLLPDEVRRLLETEKKLVN